MRFTSTVAAATLSIGLFTSAASAATLFTTTEDFAQWVNTTPILTAAGATSLDASSTNGVGNTTAANGAGTNGSLQVSNVGPTSFSYFYGPGEQGNNTFLTALGSSNAGGNLAAATGQIQFDFTTPPPGTGNYFEINLVLNYNSNFGQFSGTTVNNGNGTSTRTINYTINAVTGLSYFQLGLIYNSNYNTPTPFTIDNIRTVVPEPTSLSLLGLGALALRRRRS